MSRRPRPFAGSAEAIALAAAGLAATSILPHDLIRTALAATAGSLFEAAPVVFIASALPRRLRGLAGGAGCGCGRGVPGALAPAAIVLCWIAFGPAASLARAAAAAVVATLGRGRSAEDAREDEPFTTLLRVAAGAAAATVLAALVASALRGAPAALLAGAALGLLAPCATAGVALAAGFAGRDPYLAAAILATSGIVPTGALRARLRRSVDPPRLRDTDARFATLLTAAALALLAARGPSGLVHPRLLALIGLGAAAALVRARRPARAHPAAFAVPALLLGALASGSPPPSYAASGTAVLDGFPGERAAFTGVAQTRAGRTSLIRATITCCRIDATAVALPLDRRLPVAPGTWIAATGTLRATEGSLVLAVVRWRRVAPPPDPFAYR